MTRVVVVADSGPVLAAVSASLSRIPSVQIVAHANGRARVDRIVRLADPDIALVDEMHGRGCAADRIAEVRAGAPRAAIVGLTDRPESQWAAEALRLGACAVVPRDLQPATLGVILQEVLGTPAGDALRRAAA